MFNGNASKFDDWKQRIQDKLAHNGKHYPSESFKIAYIITRLGGKAVEFTSRRRRLRSYSSVDQLIGHLCDIYETPLATIHDEDHHNLSMLQQDKQPFQTFYAEFMKYAEHIYDDKSSPEATEQYLRDHLKGKLRYNLRKTLFNHPETISFSTTTKHLTRMDHFQRIESQRRGQKMAKRKAQIFAIQLAKAKSESKRKQPGKHKKRLTILPRPRPDHELDLEDSENDYYLSY